MAHLNHAPPHCVTMAGMPTALNLSVLKWGRGRRGLEQRRSWEVGDAQLKVQMGKVGLPSGSTGAVTWKNLEASSL